MESEAMTWVRNTRNKNSARRIKMTEAERKAETNSALEWFKKGSTKKIVIRPAGGKV